MAKAGGDQMSLYLCRHGSTQLNQKNEVRGWIDVPLSPQGQKEAQELGKFLSGVKFAEAWSDGMKRTKATASEIIAENHSKPRLQISDALLTINLGDFQDQAVKKVFNQIRALFKTWETNPTEKAPNGESFSDFQARAFPMYRYLSNRALAEDILAVSHGRFIFYFVGVHFNGGHPLEGPSISSIFDAEITPANFCRFDNINNDFVMTGMNQRPTDTTEPTNHLARLGSQT